MSQSWLTKGWWTVDDRHLCTTCNKDTIEENGGITDKSCNRIEILLAPFLRKETHSESFQGRFYEAPATYFCFACTLKHIDRLPLGNNWKAKDLQSLANLLERQIELLEMRAEEDQMQ